MTNNETLEQQTLLAGDLAVTVRGGDLMIDGDDQSNQVEVSEPTGGSGRRLANVRSGFCDFIQDRTS